MDEMYGLLEDGTQVIYHNDTAAREFIARQCPFAIAAYDCLRPPSFKADVWRCVPLLPMLL